MRLLLPSLLVLAGCASSSPPPATPPSPSSTAGDRVSALPERPLGDALTDWWETPPEPAACTVRVTRHMGEEVFESVRYFENGRQVSGTSHPSTRGPGQSRLTYEGDRLARIDYQLSDLVGEQACEAIGCEEPPSRTRGHIALRYDAAGHLVGMTRHAARYIETWTGVASEWRSTHTEEDTFDYTYDAEGRRTAYRVALHGAPIAAGSLTYEGGRMTGHTMERGGSRVERAFHYEGDRVVSQSRVTCMDACSEPHTTALEYDVAGRIVATRAPDRTVHYRYDADGHLTALNPGRPTTLRYEAGRLMEVRHDPAGRARVSYTYEGACDGVDLSPHAPSAYDGSELELCVHDPSRAVEHCIPVG